MHDEVPTHTIMQHLRVVWIELGDGTGEANTGQKSERVRVGDFLKKQLQFNTENILLSESMADLEDLHNKSSQTQSLT